MQENLILSEFLTQIKKLPVDGAKIHFVYSKLDWLELVHETITVNTLP